MRLRMVAVTLCLLGLAAVPATAQWSNDPNLNLAIADHAGEQVIPLIRSTSDGGVYIAWFDNSGGSYAVYLQRLNAAGVEQWPHNGLLVSNHAQNTALFGWDMAVDGGNNAILVFSDERDGGDLDIFAYKIGPGMEFLWGADGIELSSTNSDFEPAPRVAVASDGDAVFVWQRDPSTGDGDIRMQRIAPDGTKRYPLGPLAVVTSTGEDPGFVQIVPADNGNVILSWLRNIRSFISPRHLRARKFNAAGAPVWITFTNVYDAFSLPIGNFPEFQPDGNGGCFLAWYRSDGSLLSSFVQHVSSSGGEVYPHNGVEVSTGGGGQHHVSPSLTVDPITGDQIIFWDERSNDQGTRATYGQKISAAGARMWGSSGIAYTPFNTIPRGLPHAVPYAGGALVFLTDEPGGSGSADRLIGLRVDAAGTQLWPSPPLVVSSAVSSKSRYPVTIGGGAAKLAWEDSRNGAADVYAQNVLVEGKLGPPAAPGRIGPSLMVHKSTLTPGDLTLSWNASCSAGASDYALYEGLLGSFYSHVMRDCTDDGGDRTEELTPSAGDRYYLVVPIGGTDEGSFGTDSAGGEIPQAAGARCQITQSLAPCP